MNVNVLDWVKSLSFKPKGLTFNQPVCMANFVYSADCVLYSRKRNASQNFKSGFCDKCQNLNQNDFSFKEISDVLTCEKSSEMEMKNLLNIVINSKNDLIVRNNCKLEYSNDDRKSFKIIEFPKIFEAEFYCMIFTNSLNAKKCNIQSYINKFCQNVRKKMVILRSVNACANTRTVVICFSELSKNYRPFLENLINFYAKVSVGPQDLRSKKDEQKVESIKFLKFVKCCRNTLDIITDIGQCFLKFESENDLIEFKNWLINNEAEGSGNKILRDLIEDSFHLDMRHHPKLNLSSQKNTNCKDFFVKYNQIQNKLLLDLVDKKFNETTKSTQLSYYAGDKPLIFIFDESSSLLRQNPNRENNYFVLRQFLCEIKRNIFVLFTDTFTNLSDYIP
ncbi:hypothetical protein BpHYR1_023479, partial [Brachionus plicatilis]